MMELLHDKNVQKLQTCLNPHNAIITNWVSCSFTTTEHFYTPAAGHQALPMSGIDQRALGIVLLVPFSKIFNPQWHKLAIWESR